MAKFKIDTDSIMKQIKEITTKEVQSMYFDRNCPHCNAMIKIKSGDNICSFCSNLVQVENKITFT